MPLPETPRTWTEFGSTLASWNADDIPGAIASFSHELSATDLQELVDFLDEVLRSDLRSDEYSTLFEATGSDLALHLRGERRKAWGTFFAMIREELLHAR